MTAISWIDIWHIIFFANAILAPWTVFHRKRSVAASWAWLIVLIILPVVGFIIYGFVGRGISQENLFAINRQKHIGLSNVQKMITEAPAKIDQNDTSPSAHILIKYLDNISDDDIVGLNIPNGIPLVYELDADLKPIKHYYLGDAEAAAAAAAAPALVVVSSSSSRSRALRSASARAASAASCSRWP